MVSLWWEEVDSYKSESERACTHSEASSTERWFRIHHNMRKRWIASALGKFVYKLRNATKGITRICKVNNGAVAVCNGANRGLRTRYLIHSLSHKKRKHRNFDAFFFGGKRWIRIRARASVLARIAKRPAPKGGSWRNAPRGVNRAEYTLPTKKTAPRFAMLFFGGKRWIRTTEGGANRFTVCSLWPLGNLPTLGAGGRSRTNNLLITNQLLCH